MKRQGGKLKLHEVKEEVQYNFCHAKTEPFSQHLRHQSLEKTSILHLQPMMLSDLPAWDTQVQSVPTAGTDNCTAAGKNSKGSSKLRLN